MNSFLHRDAAQKLLQYRYWNANGMNVVIVAHEGGAKDYAAYIGAAPGVPDELQVDYVLSHGDKIEEELAVLLFPGFKEAGLRYRT